MPAGLWILVALREAKVYDVDHMLVLASAYQEVVRFEIPMQKAVLMHELKALKLYVY